MDSLTVISFSFQEVADGTAHAVLAAASFVNEDRFFVLNGDSYSEIDLKKYSEHKRLLVGKIGKDYPGKAEKVYDLILEKPTEELFSRFKNRRLIVYENYKGKEKVWGVISSL